MKLLLDQGLPRSTVGLLRAAGLDVVHVADVGLAAADDAVILDRARSDGRVVVTLDADFHALMAVSGAVRPSVIRVRIEGLRAEALAELLQRVIAVSRAELEAGALATVGSPRRVRIHRLPIIPS
jgi:predicted nuclease of predicted toxin-antitoxin system